MRFTVQTLSSLRASGGERLVFDERGSRNGGRLAVRLRVNADGTTRRDFLFVYRRAGRRRKLTLGEFGDPRQGCMTLKEANDQFESLSRELKAGKDPLEERATREASEIEAHRERKRRGTFAQLVSAYVASLTARGAPSAAEIERSLRHDAEPVIGASTYARDVKPELVRAVMRRVVARGSREQANRVRRYLQTAFRFGIEHDHRPDVSEEPEVLFGIEHNPARDVARVDRPGESGVRNVELSAEEIRALWSGLATPFPKTQPARLIASGGRKSKKRAAQATTPDTAPLVPAISATSAAVLKLLLATGGQRVEVALRAQWTEFDFDQGLWTVPLARRKNRRHARGPHVVPLNTLARAILAEQLERSGDNPFVFPSLSGRGASPCLRCDTLNNELKHWISVSRFPKSFAPRDLRQTWKARAGELGLSKEIRDRIQDHTLSDVSSRHYDSYDYIREKRIALDAWDTRLREIASGMVLPGRANVAPLRTAGRASG